MASPAIFYSLPRRRLPSLGASFIPPTDLTDLSLIQILITVATDVISASLNLHIPSLRRKSRSLTRKINTFVVLLEYLKDFSVFPLPSSADLCFKELYILLHRLKILINYCSQSSRLWLLLRNPSISRHFHDLNRDISTLLDVFPLKEIDLDPDLKEQIELLQEQSRQSKLFIDPQDEVLRCRLFAFLEEFEQGRRPDLMQLQAVFIDQLGIRDVRAFRSEIEFLEEQLHSQEEDSDLTVSVLDGFVALVRYSRFQIFGIEEEEERKSDYTLNCKKSIKGPICSQSGEAFVAVPKDFCCPISLDLMRDPVIISTGQTYDRASIVRWMEEGHRNCPNSGQMISHDLLIPNRALRGLIAQWCAAKSIPFDPPESTDAATETVTIPATTKAAIGANRATAELLVQQLANGPHMAKTVAAHELRMLAKNGKENRIAIAEAGAIPLLLQLFSSSNPVMQENSVTAILNLSLHDKTKSLIMEEEGCLKSIVNVLRDGLTEEARENAAAALFSLSMVHDYKKRIADEAGAVESLVGLLMEGSSRGKKDAVAALFNLSTRSENCERMVKAGAVSALVGALGTEGVTEEAVGALALLVRQKAGAEAVAKEDEMVVVGLIKVMRWGTPKGKENAVATLLTVCRSGGVAITERLVQVPTLAGLLQMLLLTGTKRARRKAASLARMCERCKFAAFYMET
ncbi:U-box domain-containing protein 17-like [Magnolia sinica]|uniref:U-box domain-containing protein 17-like n=1 Tax=Magnolia sinica TaxID=86752 RepID=UPI002658396C|nr:U-box domain-containing protein 17-like [Magnolia sinica]